MPSDAKSESAVSQTAPQTPEDLANVDESNEVYVEFTETDRHGIRSISGPVAKVHENGDMHDHAATVTVDDADFGIFEFILKYDDDGEVFLDAGIEANTHAQGYTVLRVDEVEALEIGKRGDYSGV